jgi:hypothetical protein
MSTESTGAESIQDTGLPPLRTKKLLRGMSEEAAIALIEEQFQKRTEEIENRAPYKMASEMRVWNGVSTAILSSSLPTPMKGLLLLVTAPSVITS